jgi:hydrogenase-4 component B
VTALFLLIPFLPLAMALAMVPAELRPLVGRLVPLAPLPALLVALLAEPGSVVSAPPLLLGLSLVIDTKRQLLLLMTALLWLTAAVYARGYIAGDAHEPRFHGLFLLVMGGNLGLVVAGDVPGFYAFFSLMTLASYVLAVFEGTGRAYRAGRVYITLSILGETLLLLGFLRAVAAADSLDIAAIGPALADEREHGLTLALLTTGFAIKAGQVPLHVWLPLAHAAAPTPASAVLSGAMIKAGILGLMLFLPAGEQALPGLGAVLVLVGIVTAFYGVGCGLPQTNPKTILAYSSLSQMGLLVAGMGAALLAPAASAPILAAIALYAAHHGLAKAALFFVVGVLPRRGAGRLLALLVAALCALSIAGLPLTAGALAKLELKEAAAVDAAVLVTAALMLLPASALATTLLMVGFLRRLTAAAGHAGGGAWLWAPFLATALAAQLVPWLAVTAGDGPVLDPFGAYALIENGWPVGTAGLVALAVARLARSGAVPVPPIPEGDVVALIPALRRSRMLVQGAPAPAVAPAAHGLARRAQTSMRRLIESAAVVETRGLRDGSGAALGLVLVVLALGAALLGAPSR